MKKSICTLILLFSIAFVRSQVINTGVSDLTYILQGNASNIAPADAQTQYFHTLLSPGAISSRTVLSQFSGVITDATINFCPTTVVGTSETFTVGILSGTTNYSISTTVSITANPTNYRFTNLSIPVTAGQSFAFYWITPTWVTNPTGLYVVMSAYLRRN